MTIKRFIMYGVISVVCFVLFVILGILFHDYVFLQERNNDIVLTEDQCREFNGYVRVWGCPFYKEDLGRVNKISHTSQHCCR